MEYKKDIRSCLIGFGLLAVSGFLGGFAWIAQLLGYIGVANGTRTLASESVWFRMTNKISTLAVTILVLLQILTLTGTGFESMRMMNNIFSFAVLICMLVGLYQKKKEEQ